MKVHEEHKSKAPQLINLALIIVSTSRFEEIKNEGSSTDKTIPMVQEILNVNSNIRLIFKKIISDSEDQIMNLMDELIKHEDINCILFSGGTGFSPKDITYETIAKLLEKEITGFRELFRYLSYKDIGSSAMLSRATGGKIKDKIVFLLPGSPNAVKLALKELILPELGHMLYLINKEE
jgi:molybdenum cofactor biosynthesis protein B